jgi:hypothetical protein
VLQEHEDLMKATLARDAAKACSLLREHFWRTTTLILESSSSVLDSEADTAEAPDLQGAASAERVTDSASSRSSRIGT